MFANVNITNDTEQFQYIVEYICRKESNDIDVTYLTGANVGDVWMDDIIFLNKEMTHLKHHNHWYPIPTLDGNNTYLPNVCHRSTIRLYFPRFSMETYVQGHKYALTVCTWICGHRVILGSYIINRYDALACNEIKVFFNEHYYEYIDVPILDPFTLIYSDLWKEWRQEICRESKNPDMVNSTGSILYCSLHPVVETFDGEYIKMDEYVGGQNSINLATTKDDFLNLSIQSNTDKPLGVSERPSIKFNLGFNSIYEGSLSEYLLETYGESDWKIKYELVIGNESNIYAICESPIMDLDTTYSFDKDTISEHNFNNGTGWQPGIKIVGSANIYDEEGESVISLLSNNIPFTEDIFKYFVKTDFYDKNNNIVNNINLDKVDMKILNINAVNKIENKIIKIDRPGDNKANIYQTVFYRATDASAIVIHPEVNENICINLDSYKHLVTSFILQIEGIKFVEMGRIKAGIVFKVVGNRLPKKISNGQYYILNQDSDLVTSGKYIYEV